MKFLFRKKKKKRSISFSLDDIGYELYKTNPKNLLLGVYSKEKMISLLDEFDITKKLSEKSFNNLICLIDTADMDNQKFRVYDEKIDIMNLLIDLRIRKGRFANHNEVSYKILNSELDAIFINWLCLQNPKEKFNSGKPRLPEQVHPGLGILEDFSKILLKIAKEENCEVIINFPEHYHTALMYSKAMYFFDPVKQGKFLAMSRDLKKYELSEVSFAIEFGCLIELNNQKYELWESSEQFFPVSNKVRNYSNSKLYKDTVEKVKGMLKYDIDWKKFNRE